MMNNGNFSRYNKKDIIQAIYCYQDSDVLINKLNIKDSEILSKLEADLTHHRISELEQNPVRGHFGISHILSIHRFIFQDLYPFAGKLREEDLWKGDTFFCKSQFIKQNLEDVFTRLKSENYLGNLDVKAFSERAAFFMAELNAIHPFRDGNGRAIREYIRCLALKNGYHIHWAQADKNQLLEASIRSIGRDLKPLTRCMFEVIEK